MGLVFARIWGDEHPRLTPAPGELLFTCLLLERIYTYTTCHHNWAHYTERRESLCSLPSTSLSEFYSFCLSCCIHGCTYAHLECGNSQNPCIHPSVSVYTAHWSSWWAWRISVFFAQLSPRSFASGLEAVPGGLPESAQVHCPWWSWATCLGAVLGFGIWKCVILRSFAPGQGPFLGLISAGSE